jgi:hypothetical protein
MFEELGFDAYVEWQKTAKDSLRMWKNNQLAMATDKYACKIHRHQEVKMLIRRQTR